MAIVGYTDHEMVKLLLKTQKRVSNSSSDHKPRSFPFMPFKDSDVLDPTLEPSYSYLSGNEQHMENGIHRRYTFVLLL